MTHGARMQILESENAALVTQNRRLNRRVTQRQAPDPLGFTIALPRTSNAPARTVFRSSAFLAAVADHHR